MDDIEILEELIQRCKECKFAACEQCEINWTQVKTLEHLLCLYNKEKEKNKELEEIIDKLEKNSKAAEKKLDDLIKLLEDELEE